MEKALELVEGWLELREEWPEEQAEILTWLYNHGLPKADVEEWLAKNASSYMADYIVESDSSFCKEFDINIDSATDSWLSRNGYMYFSECRLAELPDTIDVDRLINSFTMNEIIDNCSPHSFDDFILDYLEADQNIDTLARKFMDEIGYTSDPSYSDALLDLVYAGASVGIIDPAKYIELVDTSRLNDDEAGNWYDCLKEAGYEEVLISKFRR